MNIEELEKSFKDYISNNTYLEAFILVYSEYISRYQNDDDIEDILEFLEEINAHLPEILEQFGARVINFSENIGELISVYQEVKPFMKRKDKKEFEKIMQEYAEFTKEVEEFSKSIDENKDDTVALVFIYNGYLQVLLPITLIFSKLLLIYDKYLDYLPIEKMPKNFPDGDKSSAKDKKSDIADDLLFIDDMDE